MFACFVNVPHPDHWSFSLKCPFVLSNYLIFHLCRALVFAVPDAWPVLRAKFLHVYRSNLREYTISDIYLSFQASSGLILYNVSWPFRALRGSTQFLTSLPSLEVCGF